MPHSFFHSNLNLDIFPLFYLHNYLSPEFDKYRSVGVDSLFFNSDSTRKKTVPTLREVGVTDSHLIR
jgi:hypothetical protein